MLLYIFLGAKYRQSVIFSRAPRWKLSIFSGNTSKKPTSEAGRLLGETGVSFESSARWRVCVPLGASLNALAARIFRFAFGRKAPACDQQRYLAIVRIWPRISPPGETCVCTFAYAAPARMAVITAARSPAWSCCGG